MNRLAHLLAALDADGPPEPVLVRHLQTLSDPDLVCAAALLSGQTPRRLVTPARLRLWAEEVAQVPPWLFDASMAVAGDLAETAAHLLPAAPVAPFSGLATVMADLSALAAMSPDARKTPVLALWSRLDPPARAVLNRLLLGTLGPVPGPGPVARALARITGQDAAAIALRLSVPFDPATTALADLIRPPSHAPTLWALAPVVRLEAPAASLGHAGDWVATAWPGDLRVQARVHAGALMLWSEIGDPLTPRFPDLVPLRHLLPHGTVLDGVLMGRDAATGALLPPATLRPRLAGKAPSARALAVPARLVAIDLLALGDEDLRGRPLADRLAILDRLCAALPETAPLCRAPRTEADDWAGLDRARPGAVLLRRRDAPYPDRPAEDWLVWPPAVQTLRAVLVYVRTGPDGGTEATFALRDGEALVPVARAAPALDAPEAAALQDWLRRHTRDRFGPVRQVDPVQLFDIGFDAVLASPRHKAGLALQGARVLAWVRGADPAGIATLADLRALAGV